MILNISTIDSKKVNEMIEKNQFGLVIDLREKEHYEKGHLKNAINIPINCITDNMDFLEKYKDNKILLYCGIGSQSKSVAKVLAINGYEEIYSLANGIKNYKYELVTN